MAFCVICDQSMNIDTLYIESHFCQVIDIQKLEMHASVLNRMLSFFKHQNK